jgi:hypothetical protein
MEVVCNRIRPGAPRFPAAKILKAHTLNQKNGNALNHQVVLIFGKKRVRTSVLAFFSASTALWNALSPHLANEKTRSGR